MPIRPEMRALYPPPKEWRVIRERILARAGNCCELCGVANGAVGYRDPDGTWHQLGASIDEAGLAIDAAAEDGHKVVQIVLTIAHWENMDPADCRDENLKAACQRCHNRHDVPHRSINRAATRKRGKARADLFEEKA